MNPQPEGFTGLMEKSAVLCRQWLAAYGSLIPISAGRRYIQSATDPPNRCNYDELSSKESHRVF